MTSPASIPLLCRHSGCGMIEFPHLEIITGTWIDNLANTGPLILSGANGVTKFPLFHMLRTLR